MKLIENDNKYRILFEQAGIGMAIVDTRGDIINANKYLCDMLGYELNELIGDVVPLITEDNDLAGYKNAFDMLCKRELNSYQIEKRFIHKNGSIIWGRLTLSSVNNDLGEILFCIGVVENINDRKQAEDKLAVYMKILEKQRLEIEGLYYTLDKEVDKAKRIHSSLIPTNLPQIEGVLLKAFYLPANRLGGDIYDVKKRDDKALIYLSDVSGHGLDGAMMNFFVKNTIEEYFLHAPESEITPGHIIRYLAEKYHQEKYPFNYFVCLFLIIIDMKTGKLTYNGQGFHTSPLVAIGERELELFSEGMPISTAYSIDILDFEDKSIDFGAGGTILFSTDGLPEQSSRGRMYKERLNSLFYRNHHLPPEEISSLINDDFRKFNDGKKQGNDDITYLILQKK